jgi:transcriptional regulator of acetoin/glycerol metabolism
MAEYLLTGHSGPLMSEETDTIQHIADALAGAGLAAISLHDLEDAAVLNALNYNDGNRTYAARTLGVSLRTVQRKLRRKLDAARPDGNGNGLAR